MIELSQVNGKIFVQDCPGLSLGAHLKTGGQKCVWRCAYQGNAYVLKAIMSHEKGIRRLEREIKIMRECHSPFLPKFGPLPLRQITLDSGETIVYFLEEYIDGLPLASVHSPLPALQVIWLCRCVGEALTVLDSHGYVHRDVKPMNIIQKTSSTYVLIDAGLAVDSDGDQLSSASELWGTAPFFSPEQITLPSRDLDVRSDLFSLGVTLYQYATGEHPFINDDMPKADIFGKIKTLHPPDPRRFVPDLPEALCTLIIRLLHKDRDQRFANPEEMLTELSRVELAVS